MKKVNHKFNKEMLKDKQHIMFVFDFNDGQFTNVMWINISPDRKLSYQSASILSKEKGGFKKPSKELQNKYKKMSSEDWYRFIYNKKQACLKHRNYFNIYVL